MANWQTPKRNHTPILISFVLTRGTGRKWSSSKEALYLGKSKQDIKAIDSYFDAYPRSRCLKSKHVRVLNSSQSPIRPVFKVYFKLWVQIKPWVLCDHTENRNGGCGKNFSTAEQVGARSFFLLPRSALPWDSPTWDHYDFPLNWGLWKQVFIRETALSGETRSVLGSIRWNRKFRKDASCLLPRWEVWMWPGVGTLLRSLPHPSSFSDLTVFTAMLNLLYVVREKKCEQYIITTVKNIMI